MTSKLRLYDIEAKYLKIVSEFAIDMLSLSGVDNILWHLAQNVVAQLGFEDVVVYLLDEQRGVLVQKATYGAKNPKEHEILQPIELKIGEGVVGMVAQTKQPIIVSDTRQFPHYIVDDAPRLSELAVPMLVEGDVVGVIDTEHPKKNYYTKQHERILLALASITALKIHKAKTLVKLQQSIEALEYSSKIQDTLFEIAEIIFETDSIKAFYRRLHQCIGRLTFAKNFYVALLDDEAQSLIFPYYVDEYDQVVEDTKIAIDPTYLSITGYVLLKNQPLLVDEVLLQDMVERGDIHINGTCPKTWLGVPFGDEQFRGIVVVQSYQDSYQFTENDKQLLIFVAKHIRNAIERMNVKSRMEFLALHDPLTALPNRTLFLDRVKQALVSLDKQSQTGIGLIFLDIDRFKVINDTYGHHMGDELLKAVAKRLAKVVRVQDTFSRFSGDEFAVLLEGIHGPAHSKEIAQTILTAMDDVIDLGGIRITLSASMGLVNCFDASVEVSLLMIQADEAMYKAKLQGRNCLYLLDEKAEGILSSSYKLEMEFIQAMIDGHVHLAYQPVYSLKDGRLIGAEALIRWQHPEQGIVPPNRFLPELQRSGCLDKLDLFVAKQAIAFIKQHHYQLPDKFKLSINISGAGFNSQPLIELLEDTYRTAPDVIKLLGVEITEQTLVSSVDETKATIARLREMGVFVSLDDFGTGYSSLSYLHQFSFDLLKIDRAFISHMDMAYDNRVILETIVNLANTLNIETVAEGIETQDQYNSMRQLGCDYGQGYFMNASMPGDNLIYLLTQQPIFC